MWAAASGGMPKCAAMQPTQHPCSQPTVVPWHKDCRHGGQQRFGEARPGVPAQLLRGRHGWIGPIAVCLVGVVEVSICGPGHKGDSNESRVGRDASMPSAANCCRSYINARAAAARCKLVAAAAGQAALTGQVSKDKNHVWFGVSQVQQRLRGVVRLACTSLPSAHVASCRHAPVQHIHGSGLATSAASNHHTNGARELQWYNNEVKATRSPGSPSTPMRSSAGGPAGSRKLHSRPSGATLPLASRPPTRYQYCCPGCSPVSST